MFGNLALSLYIRILYCAYILPRLLTTFITENNDLIRATCNNPGSKLCSFGASFICHISLYERVRINHFKLTAN